MTTQIKNSESRLVQRAEELKRLKISFISSTDFETQNESSIATREPERVYKSRNNHREQRVNENTFGLLLTPEGESWLFMKMNYYKFRAEKLRKKLKPESATQKTIEQIERYLEISSATRTAIVEANLRLVVALAHKFSNSRVEFDELVSEGNMILLNSIDKFDFSRGFRFSTYSTHAIQRHFYRFMHRKKKRSDREVAVSTGVLSEVTPENQQDAPLDHKIAEKLISHFEDCLDEREVTILRDRFGLNENQTPSTLKTVSEQVGLSKERVRQLQIRAIEKLQDLAIQMNLRLEPTF